MRPFAACERLRLLAPEAPGALQAPRRERPRVAADAGEGPPPPPAETSSRLEMVLPLPIRNVSRVGARGIYSSRGRKTSRPSRTAGALTGQASKCLIRGRVKNIGSRRNRWKVLHQRSNNPFSFSAISARSRSRSWAKVPEKRPPAAFAWPPPPNFRARLSTSWPP